MNTQKQLHELLTANVISQETAEKISNYYEDKKSQSSNWVLVAFAILGSILGGLGIILIMAHNWDQFPRGVKVIFALIPLLLGQFLCGYTLFKKRDSKVWSEGSSAFLFIAIGACISLVSQIYNIPGEMSSFLLTWILLGLPLVYIMRSSISSVFYLIGITYYAIDIGYQFGGSSESYLYWILLLALAPYYIQLLIRKGRSASLSILNWLISLSLIIVLGIVAKHSGVLMFVSYMGLFGLLYNIGNSKKFKNVKTLSNGPKILGAMGTVILLIIFSFSDFWKEIIRMNGFKFDTLIYSPEMVSVVIILTLATILLILKLRSESVKELHPFSIIYLLFTIIFIVGFYTSFASVIINLLILAIGIFMIRDGSNKDHLGILNGGLLLITFLIICRFFDTDISFVLKGLLFLAAGAGFFIGNYIIINKRKKNTKTIQS